MSGKGSKNCSYFDKLDEILGTRAASEPPLVLQTTSSGAGPEQNGTDDRPHNLS